jgi:glycosyltransferase involved in cell wall biosynthesis/trans-aconitate methyltransferase
MNETLVSVIIPTYNSAKTLEACLRSIKEQTYRNIEVIVVDKFSGDGTREIAERFGAKLFRCNLSKVKARNFGSRMVKGTFLLQADSDMEFENDVIAKCMSVSSIADAIYIPETTKGINFHDRCKKLEKDIYVNDPNVEAARFIKRESFERLKGFDEEFDGLDEYAFHARLEREGIKTARINSYIIIYEDLSLKKQLKKKFYRGQEFRDFENKFPQDAKNRFSSMRFRSYTRHADMLVSHPAYSIGMFAFKFFEILAFFLGTLFPERRSKEIKEKFNNESSRYEQDMYLNTLGARFVDGVEKEAILSSFSEKGKILDLGVGTGRWSRELVKLGNDVIGVDISDKMLEVARKNIPSDRFKTVNSDMESLPFDDEEFDAINCIRAVKYAKNYGNVFHGMNRVLKKNGLLVLEVSNKTLLIAPLYYIAKVLQLFKFNKGIFNYLSHIKLFSKGEIKKELQHAGFKVTGVKTIFVVPATIYAKIKNQQVFSVINLSEKILSKFLPLSLFSRSFVVIARKEN